MRITDNNHQPKEAGLILARISDFDFRMNIATDLLHLKTQESVRVYTNMLCMSKYVFTKKKIVIAAKLIAIRKLQLEKKEQ